MALKNMISLSRSSAVKMRLGGTGQNTRFGVSPFKCQCQSDRLVASRSTNTQRILAAGRRFSTARPEPPCKDPKSKRANDSKEPAAAKSEVLDTEAESVAAPEPVSASKSASAAESSAGAAGSPTGDSAETGDDGPGGAAVESDMASLQQQGRHEEALQLFARYEESAPDVSIGLCNRVLASLRTLGLQAGDVSAMLEAYGRVLKREIKPDIETYAIVIGGLVDAARKFAASPDPGAQDARASITQHLQLANALFEASTAASKQNFDPATVDALARACAEFGVEASEVVQAASAPAQAAVISLQPSLADAADVYDRSSQSVECQQALIAQYFRHGRADLAVKLFHSKRSDPALLESMLLGFVDAGYTATAARWAKEARQRDCDPGLPALCNVLCRIPCDPEHLSSAHVFYTMISTQQEARSLQAFGEARCSYLRLCAAAKALPPLIAAIKESRLRSASWDMQTLYDVFVALLDEHPELAADVLAWQCDTPSARGDTDSRRDVLERCVALLQAKQGGLTAEVAVSLAAIPALLDSQRVHADVLRRLWDAREKSDPAVLDLPPHAQARMLELQADAAMLDAANGLYALDLQRLRTMLPLFVGDRVARNVPSSNELVRKLETAFARLEIDFSNWKLALNKKPCPAEVADSQSDALDDASAIVAGYSRTPNGVYNAIAALEALFQTTPSAVPKPEAVCSLLRECAVQNSAKKIRHVLELLSRIDTSLSSKHWNFWIQVLDVTVQVSAAVDYSLAWESHMRMLALGATPSASSYGQLILHGSNDATQAVALFNEARMRGVAANTFLYNVVLARLAKSKMFAEIDELVSEMQQKSIACSSVTYGTLISAACRAHDGQRALALFKMMEEAPDYMPRVAPFNMLMQYFIHTRQDRDSALKMYERLRACKVMPSQYTYRLLIDAYLLAPVMLDKADDVLQLMKDDGAPLTTQCFARLLYARGVLLHRFEAARDFYRGLVKNSRVLPDAHIFGALLETYVINGHLEDTPSVLDEMHKYRVQVDEDMINTLIKGWSSLDSEKVAELQAAVELATSRLAY